MRAYISRQILIASVVCLHTASIDEYFVNKSVSVWDYNNPPCTIATPGIVYTSDGPTVDIPPDLDIASNQRVLVGYTKKFEVFQNIGCIETRDLPAAVSASKPVYPDPGQCYSLCKTPDFGIYKNECFCLIGDWRVTNDRRNLCDDSCSFPINTACGGKHVRKYISVYTRVHQDATNATGSDDDGSYCRVYNPQSESFSWQTCDKDLDGLCQSKQTESWFARTYLLKRWHRYTVSCFIGGKYPAAENQQRIKTEYEAWIGRIRSWAIVAARDATEEDLKYGYYGYISKHDGQFLLEFTKERSGAVLCTAGRSTGETTTTTTSSTTTITTKPKPRTVTDTTTVQVAVYVAVPLVLLVGAVVVFLLVRRKRKQHAGKATEIVIYSDGSSKKQFNAHGKALTNASYVDDFVPNCPEAKTNDRFLPEPQYENSANCGTPSRKSDETTNDGESNGVYEEAVAATESGNHVYNYFESEKSTGQSTKREIRSPRDSYDENYDTTNAMKPADCAPNGNIYNTMIEFAEDTYNHAGGTGIQNAAKTSVTGQATDNMYSHFTRDGEPESVYNTADGSLPSDIRQIDDTYNHIG